MGFKHILAQWERQKSSAGSMAHWLESYPPGKEECAEKEMNSDPPVSEGHSVWHRRPHQDVLDLHGSTREEAARELAVFIQSMRRRGLRKGLIIHGKGLHSADGAILVSVVREYLEASSEIGELGRADRKDGGAGATWFILRQRSR